MPKTHKKPSLSQLLTIISMVLFLFPAALAGCGGGVQYTGQGTPVPSFDPRSKIYALAQQAERYRRRNDTTDNFCVVAIWISLPGRIATGPNHVSSGQGSDRNTNHCEQHALRWVQFYGFPRQVFPNYPLNQVIEINVVLFTQVRVCDPCQMSFPSWKQILQQTVSQEPGGSSVVVNLYVWEITFGSPSGFDPGLYPYGPYTSGPPKPNSHKPVPVRRQDLDQAYP